MEAPKFCCKTGQPVWLSAICQNCRRQCLYAGRRPGNNKKIQAVLDNATKEIAKLPESRRLEWISYLLEGLDNRFGEEILWDVLVLIKRRLQRKSW